MNNQQNDDMDRQTLNVAFATQKGGSGKTAITVLVAGYLHYRLGCPLAVIDCDFPQYSLYEMRERDNLANHPGRKYKEVWIGLNGVQSAVYATEVSAAEYLTYTTEESEKTEVFALAEELGGDLELAIKRLAETKYK